MRRSCRKRSEELARAEQLVNKQAESNAKSAERNLAIAAQLEQAGAEIEEERRELMNQKNSPHEYYGEIIFEKNVELNSKEAEIADLCNTISEKNSKIADLDALLDERESKIQALNCRIVSDENAYNQRLSLHQLELYRYYRDIFIYNDTEERMTFIVEHGALLERLAVFFSQKAA